MFFFYWIIYTLFIQYLYIIYTLFIYYLYTIYTLFIHYLYTIYTLFLHYLYTIYTLFIHYLYMIYIYVIYLYIQYSYLKINCVSVSRRKVRQHVSFSSSDHVKIKNNTFLHLWPYLRPFLPLRLEFFFFLFGLGSGTTGSTGFCSIPFSLNSLPSSMGV